MYLQLYHEHFFQQNKILIVYLSFKTIKEKEDVLQLMQPVHLTFTPTNVQMIDSIYITSKSVDGSL